MSKIYAIQLNNGNLHKNNLGEIVYFHNKQDVRDYMKYNHYEGTIQPFNIDIDKDKKIADLEAKLAEKEEELVCCDNARLDWVYRAKTYAALIVSLNDILPNKQEKEITFAKVIEDVKNLVAEKEKEYQRIIEGTLNSRDKLFKEQMEEHTQDKIELLSKVRKYVINNAVVATFPNAYDDYDETEPYVPKDEMVNFIDTLISEIK